MKTVGIIGAGPAGLTAAYELSKRGYKVEVFESSAFVGGMSKTIPLWGQLVDLGPHRFFSKDKRVNKIWFEIVKNDFRLVPRLTRILYKNNYYFYPLKISNVLKNLGIGSSIACLVSYLKAKLFPPFDDETFQSWVESRFGRRLFQIFFKSYSEKLWGIGCRELDSDFAAQRIKALSFFEAVVNALSIGSKNKHNSLVDRFAYPLGGTGMVYERMAEKILEMGNKIHLNTPVARIENKKIVTAKETSDFDHIISTMPLNILVKGLRETPKKVVDACDSIDFRNTKLVYLEIDSSFCFRDNWIYVHSPELKVGRITNFRNWVPELNSQSRTTILAMEYWASDVDEIWTMPDSKIEAFAKQELLTLPFMKNKQILRSKTIPIRRCYPIYRKGYKSHIEVIRSFLDTLPWLSVIGRYGAFKYNNQDHSILMGHLAAENIASGANHDLWEVNTDYEEYQEPFVAKDRSTIGSMIIDPI